MRSCKSRKADPNQKKLLIGDDDLLIEILIRIPTPVVAIRCKLVCKSWCSLISSRYFISRFKQQHIKHPKPLSGMLANTVSRVNIAEDTEFNFRGFNLDYLPEKNGKIMVVASCNDLIVIEARKNGCRECNYYLCNPFTMQWVALPPQPPPPHYRWRCSKTGLVCKPGDQFQYRIVRFYSEYHPYCREFRYHLVIYCSETSEWIPYDDRGKEYRVGSESVAAYNGKLHWVYGDCEYLVTLDPFDMRQTSRRLINGENNDNLWRCDHLHVGECEGVLRVVRIEVGRENKLTYKGISAWELQEDDEDSTSLISKDYIFLSEGMKFIKKVGFHPRNKDVLFLEIEGFLASFNTKTRELKFETQFKGSCSFRYLLTLQLPWWPTPIPSPHSPTSMTSNCKL